LVGGPRQNFPVTSKGGDRGRKGVHGQALFRGGLGVEPGGLENELKKKSEFRVFFSRGRSLSPFFRASAYPGAGLGKISKGGPCLARPDGPARKPRSGIPQRSRGSDEGRPPSIPGPGKTGQWALRKTAPAPKREGFLFSGKNGPGRVFFEGPALGRGKVLAGLFSGGRGRCRRGGAGFTTSKGDWGANGFSSRGCRPGEFSQRV